MFEFQIKGGACLQGTVDIKGAKNAVLPLMICTLLTSEPIILHNVTMLSDVHVLTDVLRHLGTTIRLDGNTMTLETKTIISTEAPYELLSKMRAAFWVLGPLLAREQKAHVSLPGGCTLGRKLDIYFDSLQAMGAKLEIEHGYVAASGQLHGAELFPHRITVGGTMTMLMAAVLTPGITVIHNAAMEPEVSDVVDLLIKMGAQIEGKGTHTLRITGVDSLHGTEHTPVPDRIETGTFICGTAMTHGTVMLCGARLDLMEQFAHILRQNNVILEQRPDGVFVDAKNADLQGRDITMSEYPGVATDDQPCLVAMSSIAKGDCVITDTVYDNRFMHVPELIRMGAQIDTVNSHSVHIRGVDKLSGAIVTASDLRGGAALVLAGLTAEGETCVQRVYHIDRGYYHLEEKLSALGVTIQRVWKDYP